MTQTVRTTTLVLSLLTLAAGLPFPLHAATLAEQTKAKTAALKTKREGEAKLREEAKKLYAELAKANPGEITDEALTKFLKDKELKSDSAIAGLLTSYAASQNALVAEKTIAAGTPAFAAAVEELVGAAPAKKDEGVAAFNSETLPSTRFKQRLEASAKRSVVQDKVKSGSDLNAGETKVLASPLPPVSDFAVHAITGVKLISPYTIKTDRDEKENLKSKSLETGSAKAQPYFEFIYSNRWAWRDERIQDTHQRLVKPGERDDIRYVNAWSDWFANAVLDGELRVGYIIGTSDKTSDTSGSTTTESIVSKGQFTADALVSLPVRYGEYYGGAYSWNLELGGGTVTDSAEFNSNTHWFAGFGHTAQVPGSFLFLGETLARPILVSARFGWGWWEVPEFIDGSSRKLKTTNGDMLDFHTKDGAAFEADVLIPIRNTGYINLGGRVYGTKPNIWMLYVGVTTDLSDIFGSLGK